MATIFRPPLITKYETPKGLLPGLIPDQQNLVSSTLKSKDTFFYGAGRGPVYDYPNPIGWAIKNTTAWPIELRTWRNPTALNLLGKDKFFGEAGQPPTQTDQPNPRGPAFPQENRSYVDPSEFWMLKDTLFGAPGEPLAYDWQNPRGKEHPVELRTWVSNLLESTLIIQFPFFLSDWPVPRGYAFPQENRGYVDASEFWMLRDTFFGLAGNPNFDWPNPRGITPATELRTWVNNLLEATLGIIVYPFALFDWPVPRGVTPSIALKTWIDATKIQLIGQDTFFGAPGQPPSYNYPNPILGQTWRIVDQPSDSLVTLLSAVIFPFSLKDWPNPQIQALPINLRTFTDPTKIQLLGKDQFFAAPGMGPQYDYLNPLLRQFPVELRSFIQRFLQEPVVVTGTKQTRRNLYWGSSWTE